MSAGQDIWSIDVGQAALKALKLRAAPDGEVELLAYDIIEHAKILSWQDADVETLIRNALEKFVQQNPDVGLTPVILAVPGNQTFTKFVPLPPVEPERIPDIIKFEATQQIPFPIDTVVWDYELLTGPEDPEQRAGIFCIKREDVYNVLNHYKGLKPPVDIEIIQAAPLALFNFMVFDGQLGEGTTVLINIGADTSDLLITDGKQIILRNLPLGGNSFTKALVDSFKLPYPKAENLKKTAASSKHAKQIFQAMRPVFSDFAGELDRTIKRYLSQNRETEITKVLGLGNAFMLPGLQRYFEQQLNVPVVKVEKFNRLKSNSVSQSPKFAENVLSFGVSFGLGVQGLGLARIKSNLVPPEVISEKRWNSKRPWFAAASGLVAAGLSIALIPGLQTAAALDEQYKRDKPKADNAIKEIKARSDAYKKERGNPEEDEQAVRAFVSPIKQREILRVVYQDIMAAAEKINRAQFAEWRADPLYGKEYRDRPLSQPTPFLDEQGRWQIVYQTEKTKDGKTALVFDTTGQPILDTNLSAGKPKRNAAKLLHIRSIVVKRYSPNVDVDFARQTVGATSPSLPGGLPGQSGMSIGLPGGQPGLPGAAPATPRPGFILEIKAATTAGCASEVLPQGGLNSGSANPEEARKYVVLPFIEALEMRVPIEGLNRSYVGARNPTDPTKPSREVKPPTLPSLVSGVTVRELEEFGFVILRGDSQVTPPAPTEEERFNAKMRWLPVGEFEGDLEFTLEIKVPLTDVVDHLNKHAASTGPASEPLFALPSQAAPTPTGPAAGAAPLPGTPGAMPLPPGLPGT